MGGQSAVINGFKTFYADVYVEGMVRNLLLRREGILGRDVSVTLDGYINGLDLGEFAAEAWLSGQSAVIDGFKTLYADVYVEGTVTS